MLRIENLRFRRPGFELGPISLDIDSGAYFVLLGPSGSGKTTMLEWIAGFYPKAAGELFIGGRPVAGLPPQERDLAIVYQDAVLFPHLSVRENLAFALRRMHRTRGEIDRRVGELAELLRVSHRLDHGVREISGGEQRRVALGRALAPGRKVLLLDEPLTGLDPDLRREMRCELGLLHRELGLTIFHITHFVGEARSLSTQVGVLLDGRLVQSGHFDEVSRHPASEAVARALLVHNYVEGTADPERGGIVIGALCLPAPVRSRGPVRARVRGLRLCGERSGSATLPGTYRGADGGDGGGRMDALVALGERSEGPLLQVPLHDGGVALRPGDRAWVDFSAAEWELY